MQILCYGTDVVHIPAGTEIKFSTQNKLKVHDLMKLIRAAGKMGMSTDFELPAIPSKSEDLASHIAAIMPQDPVDYVAKEHFWVLGTTTKAMAGALFTRLIFPQIKTSSRSKPITPTDIGLIITNREAIGLPMPPESLKIEAKNPRANIVAGYEKAFHPDYTIGTAAIQVAGLIELAENPDRITHLSGITPALQLLAVDIGTALRGAVSS